MHNDRESDVKAAPTVDELTARLSALHAQYNETLSFALEQRGRAFWFRRLAVELARPARGWHRLVIERLKHLTIFDARLIEAFNSAVSQKFQNVTLIVVDDCSTDQSLIIVENWMSSYRGEMGMVLLHNDTNAKLAVTRNTGINFSQSEYCFMLDADNIMYPRCLEKHIEALSLRPDAVAAFSLLEVFEAECGIIGAGLFTRSGLIHGNFIDAMALFRRSALIEMNGYENIPHGWEDYDLWLRLLEADKIAVHIPEILARYRQHMSSMLRTETNVGKNFVRLRSELKRRHPWLKLH